MIDSPTLLIIDDDPVIRMATARLFEAQGYFVEAADDGHSGIALACERQPDLVLLDVDLPDINGMDVCQQLKATPELAATFVVMLSNSTTDSNSQAQGMELGADGYIARPISNRELLARVQALLRIRTAEAALLTKARQQSVLVDLGHLALAGVDIEELFSAVVSRSISVLRIEKGHILRLLPDNSTLVMAASAGWPSELTGQMIVHNDEIGRKLAALQSTPPLVLDTSSSNAHFDMPDVFMNDVTDCRYTVIQGEQGPYGLLGVHSLQSRAFTPDDSQYLQTVATLLSLAIMRKQAEEKVQYVAMHDGLTGLYNRSYYTEEFRRLQASRQFPVSIIMLDVDGLKQTNDFYGHAVGDELLKTVSSVLRTICRSEDVVVRIGGDEFAVLLPNTDQTVAEGKMQQIHDLLATQKVSVAAKMPISISMGSATAMRAKDMAQTQQLADALMYQEKAAHHRLSNYYR